MRLIQRYVPLIITVALLEPNLVILPAQQETPTVRVDALKVENTINPTLFGQFVEVMFGGVDGALWGELLRNRGFEEPPNEIGLSREWQREPDNRNHDPAIAFSWDNSASPAMSHLENTVGHAMRIDVQDIQWNQSQRRGISQRAISFRRGVPYRGYVWLKSKRFRGFITVALEQDRVGGLTYASTNLIPQGTEWKKYEFVLFPDMTDPLGKFSILIHGTGRVWIDQVSLMASDEVSGTPTAVFEEIRDLRPSFIRWPGGNSAQNYHWMRGIGPRDMRPTWTNHAWWNETETSDFGTDEYLAFCKSLNAEPSITINVDGDGATADEAAAWVEYVNGPATSKYGRLRATNGHSEPYGVKYWEIGNEIFGNWEIGHTDAATYANNFIRYAHVMKAVDPTIRLIASGSTDLAWNRTLLQIAGSTIDEIAIHFYFGKKEMAGDSRNLIAYPSTLELFYSEMRSMLRQFAPGRHIGLDINEWNTSLPVPAQQTIRSALFAGGMMNGFERNGDLVHFSAVSDLVNGWSGGIIQTSRGAVYVTPTYLVNKLYSRHLGTVRLALRLSGPTFDTTSQGKELPDLDAVASLSADKRLLFINVVNRDLQHHIDLRLVIDHAMIEGNSILETVTANSPNSANDFAHPENVRIHESTLARHDLNMINLPARSVSVFTIPVHVVR